MKKHLLASALGLVLIMTGTTIAQDHSVPAARENPIYRALAETIYDSFDCEAVFEQTLGRTGEWLKKRHESDCEKG